MGFVCIDRVGKVMKSINPIPSSGSLLPLTLTMVNWIPDLINPQTEEVVVLAHWDDPSKSTLNSELKRDIYGLCTGITVSNSVAAQFQPAFGGMLYVVPFGDLPGDVVISSIINQQACQVCVDDITGVISWCDSDVVQRFMSLYAKQSLHPIKGIQHVLMQITVGGMSFGAFLVSMRVQATGGSNMLVQGQLIFKVWN